MAYGRHIGDGLHQRGRTGQEARERAGVTLLALEAQTRGNDLIRESIFEQLSRIPEDLRETHERLLNWAEWSRDRIRRGHCRSIEYRFQSGDTQQEDRGPRSEWDSLDAEALHSVVCGLPEKCRWLLHLHILHRAGEKYIRTHMGIHRTKLVGEIQRAMRMCRDAARK